MNPTTLGYMMPFLNVSPVHSFTTILSHKQKQFLVLFVIFSDMIQLYLKNLINKSLDHLILNTDLFYFLLVNQYLLCYSNKYKI